MVNNLILSLVSLDLNLLISLTGFKYKTKKWIPDNCPYRYCKIYTAKIVFIQDCDTYSAFVVEVFFQISYSQVFFYLARLCFFFLGIQEFDHILSQLKKLKNFFLHLNSIRFVSTLFFICQRFLFTC